MIKTCKNVLQLSEIVANTLLKINQHFERLVRSTKLLSGSRSATALFIAMKGGDTKINYKSEVIKLETPPASVLTSIPEKRAGMSGWTFSASWNRRNCPDGQNTGC